ncbi:MAG: hypothetical protein Q7S01_03965 [bacterium]|nr:hypothetical protein [bacterium]
MNQKSWLIVGGIIIALILVWGIWYFTKPNNAPIETQNQTATSGTNETNTAAPATATSGGTVGTNTFRSIFTQTGSHQCSYEQVTSDGKASSVIYIADGKMRGEFRTTIGAASAANLMVYSGGILYTWKEGSTTGKKSSIKSLADLPQAIPTDLTSGAGFGTSLDNVSWDCHVWSKDPSILAVPSYVKF